MKIRIARLVAFIPACLLLVTLAPSPVAGKQPALFEPTEDYYKARGPRVIVDWSLDRDTVPEDDALLATLTVRGATNPQEVVRPDLGKVRDDGRFIYADRFLIVDVPGPPVAPDAKEVAFVYRLRPRTRDVNRLPTLKFWYDTGLKVEKRFQPTRATGKAITVTPAVKPKPPAIPLVEPEHLFAVATGRQLLERGPFVTEWWLWLLLVAAGPLVAFAWFLVWRWVYPDAARLARLRRGRAVRRVADAVRKAGRAADPAGVIAAAVLGYLRTRFPLPPGTDTPAEVGDGLRAAGLPDAGADDVVAFLRRCDEARFGLSGDTGLSLGRDADALVTRLEAAE